MKYFWIAIMLLIPVSLFGQDSKSDQNKEKELFNMIQKEVEKYEGLLELDPAQTFWVDSILTCNYKAMQDELIKMNKSKVYNNDLYFLVQDKWMEASFQAICRILDENQLQKYLKSGAAREKKSRDKREAKRNKK